MPTIRKATRGSEFVHGYGTVAGGEEVDVDADTAEYLVETGAYERVEREDGDGEALKETEVDPDEIVDDINEHLSEQIEAGECPWCDDYEGENVGQHASSAHPDKWGSYKEASE